MAKLKKIKKSLIFGILAVLCLSFITVDVQAKKVTCKLNEDYLLEKFQPALVQQNDGKFTLKITKDNKVNGETIKFKITKVNGGAAPSDLKDKEVYYGKNVKDIDVLNNLKNGEYTITLHTKQVGDCAEFENKCPNKAKQIPDSTSCTTQINLDVTIEGEKDQYLESVSLDDVTDVGDWTYSNTIDCKNGELDEYRLEASYNYTGTRKHGIFKSRFCYAKIAAEKEDADGNKRVFSAGDGDHITSQPSKLKCATFVLDKADVGNIKDTSVKRLIEQDLSDGYVNGTYYKAEGKKTYETTTGYIRHLDPNTTVEGNKLKCELTCTETVKVLYEPPVASKAGFCFDYKVKVESYVNCNISKLPEKPDKDDYEYCYPSPICAHSGANGTTYYLQGGPNEDFEACIQDCDGGKYTQACSNKCYEKIYNSVSNSSKLALVTEAEYAVTRLAKIEVDMGGIDSVHLSLSECKKKVSNGCYYRKNGSVKFSANKPGRGASTYKPGTWYIKAGAPNHYKYNDSTYIVPWSDGFYRHNYGGGDFCHDSCHWVEGKCKGKYLNAGSGQLEADWKANKQLYEKIVAECKAAASCTSQKATFTISADYSNTTADYNVSYPGGNIEPPSSEKGEDYVNSNNNTSVSCGTTTNATSTCEKENKAVGTDAEKFNLQKVKKCTTAGKSTSTIMDYAGCYVCHGAKNYYMTEWTFPGTWINNKTGEISFKPKSTSEGWREEKGKFCIPLDAKNVNAKWWLWYMKKVYGANYTNTEDYSEACGQNLSKKTLEELKGGVSTIKYNIHAETKDFGYYKWNIKIDCFYAINDTAKTTSSTTSKDDDKCITTGTNYRLRDIDLTNMFPSKDGSAASRQAGFNWTSEATIQAEKDPFVATNPSVLIGEIQKRGTKIYEDEAQYLDYEFELTPAALKDIQTWTAGKAYTTPYNQDINNANTNFNACGRNTYHSTLIDKLIQEYGQGKNWARVDTKGMCCSNYNPKTKECESFIVASE